MKHKTFNNEVKHFTTVFKPQLNDLITPLMLVATML